MPPPSCDSSSSSSSLEPPCGGGTSLLMSCSINGHILASVRCTQHLKAFCFSEVGIWVLGGVIITIRVLNRWRSGACTAYYAYMEASLLLCDDAIT